MLFDMNIDFKTKQCYQVYKHGQYHLFASDDSTSQTPRLFFLALYHVGFISLLQPETLT